MHVCKIPDTARRILDGSMLSQGNNRMHRFITKCGISGPKTNFGHLSFRAMIVPIF